MTIAFPPVSSAVGAQDAAPPGPPRLVLMIPCFNEAASLGATLAELPCALPGVASVRVLVVDDGSSDGSAEIAAAHGAEVLRLEHAGLARAYAAGLAAAVARGADLIVSLDADGQYDPAALERALAPLLRGEADLVLVERGPAFLRRLPRLRRAGHRLGRWGVRAALGLPVRDPVTGYRAYTRRAAAALRVRSSYTYTLETLAQVAPLGLRLAAVMAEPRSTERPSRLMRHPLAYMARQAATLAGAMLRYRAPASASLASVGRKLLLALWLVLATLGAWQWHAHPAAFAELVEGLRRHPLAPLGFVGLVALRPLLLVPASLLSLTAGALFGFGGGVAVMTAGSNLAAVVAFALGRLLPDPAPRGATLGRATAALRGGGFRATLTLRLLFFPHDLVSIAAGAARMRLRPFLLGTLLGTLPVTALIVGVGAFGSAGGGVGAAPWIGLGAAAALAVSWLRKRMSSTGREA